MLQNLLTQRSRRYWVSFLGTVALVGSVLLWLAWAPGQDHLASIPLNGDGSWYYNYEVGFEIQDPELFFNDIGHSMENARQADIIFVGWSRLLFALDWQGVDDFARENHVKIFNMGLAGVHSGEFYLRVVKKWGLHPKLWVINTDRDLKDYHSGFFFLTLAGGLGTSATDRVVRHGVLHAYKNIVGRNIRWRLKKALGLLKIYSFRSATTGNWYLAKWPNYDTDNNPRITLMELSVSNGAIHQQERVDDSCPVLPEEVEEARLYLNEIGGTAVLIQVPSSFACAQRVHELATSVGVSAFTVDQTQFSSSDGGGHLDQPSARKYTGLLLAWLHHTPAFQKLFPQ
jgi:hypothetical protein